MDDLLTSELRTFEQWEVGKAPLNLTASPDPIPKHIAESIAAYATHEERVIVQSYPWLLRPIVRWLRAATRT